MANKYIPFEEGIDQYGIDGEGLHGERDPQVVGHIVDANGNVVGKQVVTGEGNAYRVNNSGKVVHSNPLNNQSYDMPRGKNNG